MKVIIGMSGGVDSTIAAYLLKKKGYEVIGVTMCIDSNSVDVKKEIDDAKKMCDKLDIVHDVVDVSKVFREKIIDRFVKDYVSGITPPPCSICNGLIKFRVLLDSKKKWGASKIATGHYASVGVTENGRYYIKKSKNERKDQSYMLYSLRQDELRDLLLPIGDMEKDEVRSVAKDLELFVAEKKDSEDLCFIKNIDYKEFIKKYFLGDNYQYDIANGKLSENEIYEKCPFLHRGQFIDKKNNVLGYHEGIINYTIGQRKGLNVALGERKYVLDINAKDNKVILGDNEDLYNDEIILNKNSDMIWQKIDCVKDGFRCTVKVRYRDSYHPCVLYNEDDKICIKCDKKIRAITKGQVAVCYDEDGTLFGGIIV